MNGSSMVFTFTAYQEIGSAKDVCFVIILLVYLATVIANISVMLLIYFDSTLHKPMYIFLFGLLLVGLIGSTSVWPRVLAHLATIVYSVSYVACFVQTYVISAYGACVYMSLTVMAYDRYVCIFQPLQYHAIMTPRKVRILLVSANLIPAIIVLTYKLSGDARKKAFVTCTPHLITFLNFSLCSLFAVVYHRAHAKLPVGGHVFMTSVYVLLPPALHPLVYGIKNQEIRKRFSKITRSVLLRIGYFLQYLTLGHDP
ncbi:olfactory receptor 10H2-like [Engraulis encrasicolus]|uniref:olfactory receptor 10H2-like n=1 Tax=Engraulis encrasicolus TaxID=184585 RepID=UPI002FD3C208